MEHFAKTFFTDIKNIYDAENDALLPLFYDKLQDASAQRKARIERVRDNLTKAELLVSELLRNHALSEVFGIKEPIIITGENGKPLLKDETDKFFNVSHSYGNIVCTVSDIECGVDTENINYPHDLMRISNRFFSIFEQSAMMMSQNPNEAFCRLWTLRESYVKMRGSGFAMGLKALRCDFHRGKASIYENDILQSDAVFYEFKDIPGCRSALCTKEEVTHEIKHLSLS